MKNVCVITGGGSGMGLAAAKFMPKEKIIVISGRTVTKLENAVKELKALGYEAYAYACDTSDRESVKKLAEYAASLGEIKNVINAAGISPTMGGAGDQEKILRINALGTVYVNQEFSKKMNAGSVICDISSNSAYSLPSFIIPKKLTCLPKQMKRLSLQNLLREQAWLKLIMKRTALPTVFQKISFAGMPQKVHLTSVQRESELFLSAPVLLQQIWVRWKKNTADILSNYPVRIVWGNPKNSVMLLQL